MRESKPRISTIIGRSFEKRALLCVAGGGGNLDLPGNAKIERRVISHVRSDCIRSPEDCSDFGFAGLFVLRYRGLVQQS